MKKLCRFVAPFALAAAVVWGCSEDTEVQPGLRIVSKPGKIVEVEADATDYSIHYKIVGDAAGSVVKAVSRCVWIEVKEVTAETVNLTLVPNRQTEVREGEVDLKAEGMATVTVMFRQAAYVPVPKIHVKGDQPIVIACTDTEAIVEYELLDVQEKDAIVTVEPKVAWLSVKSIDTTEVTLAVDPEGAGEREGVVTLSYEKAESVEVAVRQSAAVAVPVIRVEGETTVEVGMRASEHTLQCSVDNGSVEHLAAEPSVEWLTVGSKKEGAIVVAVAANYEGAREGGLKLSCDGAEDLVVTFRQEARPKPVLTLEEESKVIVADPNGNDERNEDDVLTAYYRIENPIEAMSVTARPSDDWIVISEAYSSFVDFRTRSNDTDNPREGTITLSYRSADDVIVTVKQGVLPDPVITVRGEQPLRVGRKGEAVVYANFGIENRRGDETPAATPVVEWIRMISTSTGYMSFSVDPNDSEQREGRITLSYRNAEPVDFVVLQAGAPPVGGEGLVVSVSDITSTSATVGVVTYIDETYSMGVIPKSDLDKFAGDKAFVDKLVYEMRQEFASLPGNFYTFAQYFALTDDDSRVPFGVGEGNPRLLADTDYYAFAFDITADAENRVSYSGTLYKTSFRTLPGEEIPDMTFVFSFEGEGTKAKLKCTPSETTRPYCLCVLPLSYVDMTKGAEAVFRANVNRAGEFFTGEAVSASYLSKYTSPYVALACGYDAETGDITSTIAVFEFEFPPAATAAYLRRIARR